MTRRDYISWEFAENSYEKRQLVKKEFRRKPVLHMADPYFLDYARLRPRKGCTLNV